MLHLLAIQLSIVFGMNTCIIQHLNLRWATQPEFTLRVQVIKIMPGQTFTNCEETRPYREKKQNKIFHKYILIYSM